MNYRLTASLTLSLISVGSLYAGDPRIVGCNDVVQSHKRGVCENSLSDADFQVLSPGVSWYYDWGASPKDVPSAGNMTFIPMVWGNNASTLNELDGYLARTSTKPPVILAVNEPNLRGQAFITPEQTADLYKKVRQIGDTYQIPVVGPNMALGSGGGQSITAFDPIENKKVTYTFMIPFIKAFQNYLGDPAPQGVAIHTYGNNGEMQWAIDTIHKTCNTPVWVTEFAYWNAHSDQDEIKYMMQATDFLERTDYVQGYAWFEARLKEPKLCLLDKQSGELTPLGQAYVNMPVHDKDVYYKIPGNLSAGKYTNLNNADVSISPSNTLMIDSKGANTGADYNVCPDHAGTYTLNVHFLGKGVINLTEGNIALGSVSGDSSQMNSIPISLNLQATCQTITLKFQANGVQLDSLEFK